MSIMEYAEHGTIERYRQGCHLECCRAANRARVRQYRLDHPESLEKERQRKRLANGSDPLQRRVPVKCGTRQGVQKHWREKTTLCDQCQAFLDAKQMIRYSDRPLKPCGTPAAIRRHYRNNEPIDEVCRTAHNLNERRRKSGT